MATFLELVNDVGRESGTMGGQQLASVANAAGRWLKVVNWTRQAWEIVQRDRSDWLFLRKQFTASLFPGKARYTPVDLAINDFGSWPSLNEDARKFTMFDPTIGRADEAPLLRISYDNWLARYDIGVVAQNRPTDYAFGDDRALYVGLTPNRQYTIRGHYRRSIQSLSADADIPYIHPDYHQIVVWRALMLLGDDDESQFEVASSSANFFRLRDAMIREYVEECTL